jgi:hypothetical protein
LPPPPRAAFVTAQAAQAPEQERIGRIGWTATGKTGDGTAGSPEDISQTGADRPDRWCADSGIRGILPQNFAREALFRGRGAFGPATRRFHRTGSGPCTKGGLTQDGSIQGHPSRERASNGRPAMGSCAHRETVRGDSAVAESSCSESPRPESDPLPAIRPATTRSGRAGSLQHHPAGQDNRRAGESLKLSPNPSTAGSAQAPRRPDNRRQVTVYRCKALHPTCPPMRHSPWRSCEGTLQAPGTP